MASGAGSATFRAAIEERWLPALKHFGPEIIIVSAGFDGHKDDPMAELNLTDDDYRWLGELIHKHTNPKRVPILSILEGGYNLNALGRSVSEYINGAK